MINYLYNIFINIMPHQTVNYLNYNLINNSLILINKWSIIHFFTGIFLGILFPFYIKSYLIINILYEFVEHYFSNQSNHPFFAETFKDSIWDLILIMSGFIIGSYF